MFFRRRAPLEFVASSAYSPFPQTGHQDDTIVSIHRRNGEVALGGDGQVSLNNTIMKAMPVGAPSLSQQSHRWFRGRHSHIHANLNDSEAQLENTRASGTGGGGTGQIGAPTGFLRRLEAWSAVADERLL